MNSRTSLHLVALTVLLAVTSAAFTQPVTVPEPGSVSGIVSSVDRGARLIYLLDTKLVVDASDAEIRSTRGPESFADIVVGAEIQGLILPGPYTADEPLKARVIQIVTRPSTLLSGRIELVNLAADTITIFGKNIQITSATRFTSTIGGGQPRGIEDLLPNQLVVIELSGSEPGLVALKVTILQPSSGPLIAFYGRLIAIQGDLWTVSPDNSRGTTFRVTTATAIVGNPQIGDYVNVTARLEGGTYTAVAVLKASPPPPIRGVRLVGKLTELTNSFVVITDANLVQTRLTVNQHTQFNGNPRVGDQVVIIGEVYASGEIIATRIEKEGTRPPIGPFTVVGTVTSKTDQEWIVGRWTILVSPRTSISGDIRVGDRVRVVGERQLNSFVIVAYEIHKE